ncbi:hypothetical protein Gotri_016048 [Gossypium trilobum]|uniref:Wall-associated receptor kinase galacturonan-binding domain-containing protein n=1 Tax=Gossypium trilobum TaxID=34281 RepID=A0A7J9E3F5_9ROSI|nr:hypothetical protein [Gossypium trilobum]
MDALSSFSILFLLTIFQLSYAQDDFLFTSCTPFDCGKIVDISYPFWTDQHNRPSYYDFPNEGYTLKCRQNQPPVMTLNSQEFYVLHLNCRGLDHRFSCRKGGKETSLMFFKEDKNECIGNSEQVEILIGKKAFDDLISEINSVNESLVEPFDMRFIAYGDYF